MSLHLETFRPLINAKPALIAARLAAIPAAVAPALESPPMPVLLLGAGLENLTKNVTPAAGLVTR